MIQRAAGATSQVSITASPAAGVEGGQSVKVRNILVNLKTTAFALPGTLPALLAVYERNGSPRLRASRNGGSDRALRMANGYIKGAEGSLNKAYGWSSSGNVEGRRRERTCCLERWVA